MALASKFVRYVSCYDAFSLLHSTLPPFLLCLSSCVPNHSSSVYHQGSLRITNRSIHKTNDTSEILFVFVPRFSRKCVNKILRLMEQVGGPKIGFDFQQSSIHASKYIYSSIEGYLVFSDWTSNEHLSYGFRLRHSHTHTRARKAAHFHLRFFINFPSGIRKCYL